MSGRTGTRLVVALAACAVALLSTVGSSAAAVQRQVPAQVYGPSAADPGLLRVGSSYYAFMTGGPLGEVARSNTMPR